VTLRDDFWAKIRSLWAPPDDARLGRLLPSDAATLAGFYSSLKAFLAETPRAASGFVDPGAVVRGVILSRGADSVIEAGAIVHDSCRLVLGPGSRVRSGAILREEVVVGPRCVIGAHCELARTVVLGPDSYLGHYVYAGDSIFGRDVNVAGNVFVANTKVRKDGSVSMKYRGERIDSGRTHLGALVGDGVRFGASTLLCPGSVVLPGLNLPPAVVLYGTIDAARRDALMQRFFSTWDLDD
jgi:UDP-N-acetylglucosamine diphosphorylase / glucose-1-phosphate thymidylyltransferase / UDP-N-acetylgalactosamine diphosphorylase / glucosamine-1-phosphate N-acetyltransferase / galactosamine-1-phosphate N-acetyltransferase